MQAPVKLRGRSALSARGEGSLCSPGVRLCVKEHRAPPAKGGIQVVPRSFIALKPCASGLSHLIKEEPRMKELPKVYEPKAVEKKIYDMWMKGGYFKGVIDIS